MPTNVPIRRKATVLVVDDTPENIDVLIGVLKPFYKVKIATSGEKALQLCSQAPLPDLILLDIMMPGMDGYEVCRRLKAEPLSKYIPVIFVSAMSKVCDELQGFEVGGVDYITKPILPAIVLARVKTHLQLKAAYHFIRDTFGRYLSDEVASLIIESPDGLNIGGIKRELTVMMADLRGFTSISAQMPAEHVVEMINVFLSRMTDVIQKYHGTIDEFIGDGILATFGATIEHDDHALQAVECAIEMQQAMADVNQVFSERGFPLVEMGIGIHTGEAVIGNIGSRKRAKYGVVGQTVNIASRIESHTVGGQVLVSDATHQACRGLLTVRKETESTVKGIQQPLILHDVTAIAHKPEKSLLVPRQEDFINVAPPLPVSLMPLIEKTIGEPMVAQIIALALPEMHITLAEPLPNYSDVKITINDADGTPLIKELYAKVISRITSSPFTCLAHITFSSPEDKRRLSEMCITTPGDSAYCRMRISSLNV